MLKRKQTSVAKKGWKMRNRTSQVKQPAAVKRRNLWDPESVVKAMNNAILGKMGVNKAAEQYDIPATTLKDRIS